MSICARPNIGDPTRPDGPSKRRHAIGDIVTVRYGNSVRYCGVIDAVGASAFLYHVTAVDGRAPSRWVFHRDIEGKVDVTRSGPGDKLVGPPPRMARGCS